MAQRQPERHRWVRIAVHNYLCAKCGTGRVNAQTSRGEWYTRWHLPTGKSTIARVTPPCQRGLYTVDRLDRHALAIEAADDVRARVLKERT